jgi:beta-lactamase class A
MSESLAITDDALSYDAGSMELGAGEMLTVAEALERMVTLSDNTSAIMLGSRVGPGRISANLAALGMNSTHYSLERMTTSALDMLHLVELMADGKAVSASASTDMLHVMLRQHVNDRLPRLLPSEVQVAHKTGNLPGTVNDVGILYGPTATIAVAALISDTDDEATAADAIARVALAAYTYFEEQPEMTSRPLIPPAPHRPVPPVWRVPQPPTPTPEPTTPPPSEAELPPTATPVLARPTPAQITQTSPTPVAAAQTPKPTPAPPAPTATPPQPAFTPTPLAPSATKAPPHPTATPNRR